MSFIANLTAELQLKADRETAIPMENYMKNKFPFLGIKTDERRAILKIHWKKHPAEIKQNFRSLAWELFQKPEREFHYCGLEIMIDEGKKANTIDDIHLIEKLITTHSWWDTVDFLAKYVLGNYLLQFPDETLPTIERFSNSKNMWLNRSAILFQLSYKKNTNFDLLTSVCEQHKDSDEFFIQKAIGWALRDYGRFNPNGVLNYVDATTLKPLSKREALRNLK